MAAPVFLSRKEKSKNCPFAIDGLNGKVAWHPRNWTRVTDDTGIGNPSAAKAEKGRRYADAVIDRYVALLKDITEKGDIYLKEP